MFRIDEYIDELTDKLINAFGKRLEYVGLQGSYLRHEETKNSDIAVSYTHLTLPTNSRV